MSYLARRVAGRSPTLLLLLVLTLEGAARLLVAVLRRPWLGGPLVLLVLGWWLVATHGGLAVVSVLFLVAVLLGAVVAAWSWLAPVSFDEHAVGPARSWRRRRYYGPRWSDAMHGCGLVRAECEPVLMSVRAGATVDELLVHMAPGQLVTDWRDAANRLAGALEVRSLRVRRDGPRDVLLLVRHSAVSWRESAAEVDAEVEEVAEQLAAGHGSDVQLAEQIVAGDPEPTEVHDVPRPGEGRAFPRRPR